MEERGELCKVVEDLEMPVKGLEVVKMSGEEGVRCEREANWHLRRRNGENAPR